MVATLPNDVFLPFAPDKPWLAPLAGWSDLPFRLLCRRFGAAVCCTEMISAKGLIYKSPGTAELFATCPEDGPVVVQLFGSEAPFMEAAAGQLRDKGFVWFDCNMGCSVPKVARTGSGAAMCKDIDNALAVAEALIRAAGRGRVGFKLRLGWDEPGRSPAAETWRVLAPALEELSQQVKVVKVDVDENPQLAMAFQVSSIPTVVSFRDGKALKKSVGVVPGEKLLELLK